MKWCPRRSPAGFAHSSAETPSPSCAGSSTCEVAPLAEERISAAADPVRAARRPQRGRLAPARAGSRRRQRVAISDLRARSRPRAPAHRGGDRHERVRSAQAQGRARSEEHTFELQSQSNLVCRLLLEKKKKTKNDLSPIQKNQPKTRIV